MLQKWKASQRGDRSQRLEGSQFPRGRGWAFMDHYQLQSFPPRSQWLAAAVAQRDSPGGHASPEGSARRAGPRELSTAVSSTGRMGLYPGPDKSRQALCSGLRPSPPPLGQLPRTRGSSTSHSTSWSLSLLIPELEQWCCDEDSVRSCTQRAADPTRVQALAGGIGWHSSAEGYSGAQAVSNITTARAKPAHDTDVASSIL